MADQTSSQNPGQGGSKKSPAAASKILAYQNQDISAETQQMLNNPIEHPKALDPKEQEFLAMLMDKVDKGEINLYRPSTLLNFDVYDKLTEESKGKADYEAMNLLGTIREIRKLWNLGYRNTYQIENLTHRIRVAKERLEEVGGDIYII